MSLYEGLVLVSDSRTNAGIDKIGRFEKMKVFDKPGDRVLVTLSSGNLSVTQNALSMLSLRARAMTNICVRRTSIHRLPSSLVAR